MGADQSRNPLFDLADEGKLTADQLQSLIEKKINVNESDKRKGPPVVLAAKKGHLTTVQLLVEVGACNLALVDGAKHRNAFLWACINGHTSVVRYLVEVAHFPIHTLDKRGLSGIELAADKSHSDIVRFLALECTPYEPMLKSALQRAHGAACKDILKLALGDLKADVLFYNKEKKKWSEKRRRVKLHKQGVFSIKEAGLISKRAEETYYWNPSTWVFEDENVIKLVLVDHVILILRLPERKSVLDTIERIICAAYPSHKAKIWTEDFSKRCRKYLSKGSASQPVKTLVGHLHSEVARLEAQQNELASKTDYIGAQKAKEEKERVLRQLEEIKTESKGGLPPTDGPEIIDRMLAFKQSLTDQLPILERQEEDAKRISQYDQANFYKSTRESLQTHLDWIDVYIQRVRDLIAELNGEGGGGGGGGGVRRRSSSGGPIHLAAAAAAASSVHDQKLYGRPASQSVYLPMPQASALGVDRRESVPASMATAVPAYKSSPQMALPQGSPIPSHHSISSSPSLAPPLHAALHSALHSSPHHSPIHSPHPATMAAAAAVAARSHSPSPVPLLHSSPLPQSSPYAVILAGGGGGGSGRGGGGEVLVGGGGPGGGGGVAPMYPSLGREEEGERVGAFWSEGKVPQVPQVEGIRNDALGEVEGEQPPPYAPGQHIEDLAEAEPELSSSHPISPLALAPPSAPASSAPASSSISIPSSSSSLSSSSSAAAPPPPPLPARPPSHHHQPQAFSLYPSLDGYESIPMYAPAPPAPPNSAELMLYSHSSGVQPGASVGVDHKEEESIPIPAAPPAKPEEEEEEDAITEPGASPLLTPSTSSPRTISRSSNSSISSSSGSSSSSSSMSLSLASSSSASSSSSSSSPARVAKRKTTKQQPQVVLA